MLGGNTAAELSMMGVFLDRSLALLLAAVPAWVIGTRLNRRAEKILYDKQMNEDVVVRSGSGHSCFFMPMQC